MSVGDLQTQLVALPVTVGAGPGVLAQAEILQHILPRQLGLALRIGQITYRTSTECPNNIEMTIDHVPHLDLNTGFLRLLLAG